MLHLRYGQKQNRERSALVAWNAAERGAQRPGRVEYHKHRRSAKAELGAQRPGRVECHKRSGRQKQNGERSDLVAWNSIQGPCSDSTYTMAFISARSVHSHLILPFLAHGLLSNRHNPASRSFLVALALI